MYDGGLLTFLVHIVLSTGKSICGPVFYYTVQGIIKQYPHIIWENLGQIDSLQLASLLVHNHAWELTQALLSNSIPVATYILTGWWF